MSEGSTPPKGTSRPRNWRWLLLAGGLVLCSLVMVLGAAALGAYHGARDRVLATRQAALEHYQRGLEHRQAGELELARVEFEEALRLNPGLEQARRQLNEIASALTAQPTATSETRTHAVEALLAEAQELYSAGQWEETARRLETIRGLDPDFQPELLAELLYNTYLSAAQEMEQAGRDEEALAFYDKALALRPEDPGIKAAQERLSLYGAVLASWGRDWEDTIRTLERLRELDPTFRDVEPRLARALVAAGDAYRQQERWCLAADRYARALLIRPDEAVQQKADAAQDACENPTPTPRPAVTAAAPMPTPDASPEATVEAAAALTGKILFSAHDPSRGVHQVLMVPAQGGEPVVVAEQASQPAVSPDGQWLAFHSWEPDRLGILMAPLAGGERRKPMRTTYLEDIQPTWGPEGKRLAFGSNRHGDRKWRVYVTWVEGREEAQELVFGEAPDWSRADGRIVFRGCGPACEVWGLYVTDEQGASQELLLADPSATAPAWSPDGKWVAFMSNRDGNWELYLVGADGLGLRRLTNGPEHDGVPAWSPDGKWIAFLSHRTGAWGVYALPLEPGQDVHLVTMVPGEYPDWMQEQLAWVP
ncbi:MAG: PD40 domain-containing protein [Anaerolineae bacterium]|nr:PD40 domain-containing protein [Anaerolineae bacterium]